MLLKRSSVIAILLTLISSSNFPANSLDPTDTEKPKLVSFELLTKAQTPSDPHVFKIVTEDDKNWVKLELLQRYNFSGKTLPACSTESQQLPSGIEEISRAASAGGKKTQTFLFHFFTPTPAKLPPGCPDHQTASNFYVFLGGYLGCTTGSCLSMRDEAGFEAHPTVFINSLLSGQVYISPTPRKFCAAWDPGFLVDRETATTHLSIATNAITALTAYASEMPLEKITLGPSWVIPGDQYLAAMKQARTDLQQLLEFRDQPTLTRLQSLRICQGDQTAAIHERASWLPALFISSWSDGYVGNRYVGSLGAELTREVEQRKATFAREKAVIAELRQRAADLTSVVTTARNSYPSVAAQLDTYIARLMLISKEVETASGEALTRISTELQEINTSAGAIRQQAYIDALKKNRKTITCVKGKTVKKVTSLNPVCPKGYKRK